MTPGEFSRRRRIRTYRELLDGAAFDSRVASRMMLLRDPVISPRDRLALLDFDEDTNGPLVHEESGAVIGGRPANGG